MSLRDFVWLLRQRWPSAVFVLNLRHGKRRALAATATALILTAVLLLL
jgi:hypothetical protein